MMVYFGVFLIGCAVGIWLTIAIDWWLRDIESKLRHDD